MTLLEILGRVGREINQDVYTNKRTVTLDDMVNAFNDCNRDLSNSEMPFNEAGPVTGTWAANTESMAVSTLFSITDFAKVERLEFDSIKASYKTREEIDTLRGSFDVSQDSAFPVHPSVYTLWGSSFFRYPYTDAVTAKMWYYKELSSSMVVGVDQADNKITGANTYTVPTSISESATALQTFTPTQANQGGIMINVNTDGGQALTVTVHNSSNVSQGSKTIYNPGAGEIFFPISWTWAAGTYHFHVTVEGGTTKLTTGTASDLETCHFKSFYSDTPTIPNRYHDLYFYYAVAVALRKLKEIQRAATFDDGVEVEDGGRSMFRIAKWRAKQQQATKHSDGPSFATDLLEGQY